MMMMISRRQDGKLWKLPKAGRRGQQGLAAFLGWEAGLQALAAPLGWKAE